MTTYFPLKLNKRSISVAGEASNIPYTRYNKDEYWVTEPQLWVIMDLAAEKNTGVWIQENIFCWGPDRLTQKGIRKAKRYIRKNAAKTVPI